MPLDTNPIKNPLEIFEKSKFDFFLTGSHFFGTATHLSDIDLFVANLPEVREFLVTLGFKDIPRTRKHRYSPIFLGQDKLTSGVLRATIEGKQIDVQLCNDTAKKLAAQKKLLELGYRTPSIDQWNLVTDFV